MLIIGCDFHTRYQQIAMADESHWRVASSGGWITRAARRTRFFRSLAGGRSLTG